MKFNTVMAFPSVAAEKTLRLEPSLAYARNEHVDPSSTASNTLMREPMRAWLRRLTEDPMARQSMALKAPTREMPRIEIADPALMKLSTEAEELRLDLPSTETELPSRVIARTEQSEPASKAW